MLEFYEVDMYNSNYIGNCVKHYESYIEAPRKAVETPPKRPKECKTNKELNDIYDFIDSLCDNKNNKTEKKEITQEEYEMELKRLYEEFSRLPDDVF